MKVDVRILTFGLILLFFNLFNAGVTFAAVKILKQPDNVIVFEGSRARMAVQAKGAPKISYQWKKDGAVLPGQTRSSLTFSSASKSHRGHYTVDVTGRGRTVTSQSAVFLAQQPYQAETEDFQDADTVGFLADGDTGLHAFIADGVLKVSYFGRPSTIEDQTYWVWDKSARQGTGFDVKIDGLDSTRGKFQFIATAHGGLSYRIERNGSRRNFNAGSWGDDGLSVPRNSFSTSTTNFSFRLVYSPKRKTLQAFFDRNGPIGGVKWELLQTVKNPNFPRNVPILIMFVYNNNETGQALNGSQVQADNFLAR